MPKKDNNGWIHLSTFTFTIVFPSDFIRFNIVFNNQVKLSGAFICVLRHDSQRIKLANMHVLSKRLTSTKANVVFGN